MDIRRTVVHGIISPHSGFSMYSQIPTVLRTYRFDAFEVDTRTGELRRGGAKMPLQDVPFRFLAALLERPGQLCSRDELRSVIWPADVHLDFDGALATAARKVRQALGDDSHAPRYLETLPGRGFRFIGEVHAEPVPGTREVELPPGDRSPAVPMTVGWLGPLGAGSLIGAALLLLLLGLAYVRHWPPFVPSVPPRFVRLTTGDVEIYSARLMPGGREAVVGGAWNGGICRITRIAELNMEQRETALVGYPLAVSRSGQWAVALRPERIQGSTGTFKGALAVGSFGDSTPKEMQDDVLFADFGPDGTLAVVRYLGDRFRLECPPGAVRVESPELLDFPRFSPDGKSLAFLQHVGLAGRVALLDLSTGRLRSLSGDYKYIRGLAWKGEEVWFTAGVPTQADLLAVDRIGIVRVVYKGTSRFQLHDIGPDGQVLLGQSEVRPEVLVWDDRGEPPRVLDRKGHFWMDELSRDGRQVVGWHLDPQGNDHIILFRSEGGLPLDLGKGIVAALSPDGRWVAVVSLQPSRHLEVFPTGIGEAWKLPLPGFESIDGVRWMPDGKRVLFSGHEPGRSRRVFLQGLQDEKPQPVTAEGSGAAAHVSPDGQRFIVDHQRTPALASLGSPRAAPEPIKGLEAGDQVGGWTQDSRSLYVFRPGRPPLRVWKLDPNTGRRTFWKSFSHAAQPGAHLCRAFVTADGRTVAAQSYRNPGTLYLVDGLK